MATMSRPTTSSCTNSMTKTALASQAKKGMHYFFPTSKTQIHIPGGVSEHSVIVFEVTFTGNPNSFNIEFYNYDDPKDKQERVFHFRYDVSDHDKTAIMYYSSPQDPRGKDNTRFYPEVFKTENPFIVTLKFHSKNFEFQINDLPPNKLGFTFQKFTCVTVSKGLKIRNISYLCPSFPVPSYHLSVFDQLRIGDCVSFYGKCPKNAKNFKISFLACGPVLRKINFKTKVLLELEVNFGTDPSSGVIVMKEFFGDGRGSQNPADMRQTATIKPGQPFQLDLWVELEPKLKLVFGLDRSQQIGWFQHPCLGAIGAIKIEGGVTFTSVHLDRCTNQIFGEDCCVFSYHQAIYHFFLQMPVSVVIKQPMKSVIISLDICPEAKRFEITLKGVKGDIIYLLTVIAECETFVIKQNQETAVVKKCPFVKGSRFHVDICHLCRNQIGVGVNGAPTFGCDTNVIFSTITSVEVTGDVNVYRIVIV